MWSAVNKFINNVIDNQSTDDVLPNELEAASSSLANQPMSFLMMERELNTWVNQAPPEEAENRVEAKNQILQSFTEGKDKLDLSDLELSSLPGCIGQLRQLKHLNLSDNQLTTLPDSISHITRISTINLKRNPIKTLPKSITQLQHLENLKIDDDKLSSDLRTIFKSLKDSAKQRKTNMKNQLNSWISQSPEDEKNDRLFVKEGIWSAFLYNEKKLSFPHLRSGNVSDLPECLGELADLTELSIKNTKISKLPQSIKQLTQLHTLDFSGKIRSEQPERTHSLTHQLSQLVQNNGLPALQHLKLRFNSMNTVPESVTQLTQLTQLSLDNNQLNQLPSSFSKLSRLTKLNLSGNHFCDMPEPIVELSQLTDLDLSCNKLSSISNSIGKLSNLSVLDVSNNLLFTLPETLAELKNLTVFNASSNNFRQLPEHLREFWDFKQLKQKEESFDTDTPVRKYGHVRHVAHVDQTAFDMHSKITHWLYNSADGDASDAYKKIVNAFEGQYKELNLSWIKTKTLPDCFAYLSQLTKLDLSHSKRNTLPEQLATLTKLQKLDLYNNELTTLPSFVGNFKKLRTLDLGKNKIVNVPEIITELPALKELDLSNNQITTPPEFLGKLKQLTTLNLNGNPIEIENLAERSGQSTALKQALKRLKTN